MRTVTMAGTRFTLTGDALTVGQQAPDFELLDNELNIQTLRSYQDKVKLISVVPSLDTGVCDQQTRRFNEEIASNPHGIVITVSVDLPFAQKRWCGNAGLESAITLSDHRTVSFGKSYGVLIPDLRLLSRAVFVLDKNNTIVYIQYLDEQTIPIMMKHYKHSEASQPSVNNNRLEFPGGYFS